MQTKRLTRIAAMVLAMAVSAGPMLAQSQTDQHVVSLNELGKDGEDYPLERIFERVWISSLCRILLATQQYRHGGAILIIPNSNTDGLNIKYPIRYVRLSETLIRYCVHLVEMNEATEELNKFRSAKDGTKTSIDKSHRRFRVSENDKHDCQSALAGSIGHLASLSCVDGLVLLSSDLAILGFGVEILESQDVSNLYVTKGVWATKKGLARRDPKSYGTRHRSMIRYCSHHPKSIGFVISQDGPVRAMMNLRGRVVMWEDIQLKLSIPTSPDKEV